MEVISCGEYSDRSTGSFWASKAWQSFWMRGLDPLTRYTPWDKDRKQTKQIVTLYTDFYHPFIPCSDKFLPALTGHDAQSQLCTAAPQRVPHPAYHAVSQRDPPRTPSPFCSHTQADMTPCTSCAKPVHTAEGADQSTSVTRSLPIRFFCNSFFS